MQKIRVLTLCLCTWLVTACSPAPEPADFVLLGGRIVTMEDARPEVEALASRNGYIVALGTDAEIEAFVGPQTVRYALDGRLAVPGLIEGHGHFEGLGQMLQNVDLVGADSWQQCVARVAERAAGREAGNWILGRGWHQEKWSTAPAKSIEGNPVHDALSRAVPDHPVILRHASGHSSIVNAAAMKLAGIDASTPDPPGGEILHRADGSPSGVLRETAQGLVYAALQQAESLRSPESILEERREALKLAGDAALAHGITSFQDAGVSLDDAALYRTLAESGDLGVRLWTMIRSDSTTLGRGLPEEPWIGLANDMFTVRALKLSIDGALGSHGAWLLEPYEDLPETSGLNTVPIDEVKNVAAIAAERGYQLCVHAIGDRANRETLDIFEQSLDGNREARWRIEHAQHLNPDDIGRFADLGVIASMQGVHCTSDGPWVPKRIGMQRAESGAYLWRSLLDAGVIVSNGTDVPVEPIDPIQNFHSTVTRLMSNGETFFPDQKMTRMEALRSMTWNAAYAAFEEQSKGSLAVGKFADITVFTKDILTVPAEEIREAKVAATIVGGQIRYRREE
jgi:predicted amidohydrolase YtcJ